MNRLDKILLHGILFLFSFVWLTFLIRDIAAGVFIALLVTVLLNRLLDHFGKRKRIKQTLTVGEMENLLALYGIPYQVELIFTAAPPYFKPRKMDNAVIVSLNLQDTLIVPNYKYSACNQEEIAKYYRTAKEHGIKTVWVLSRTNARGLILFTRELDVVFRFISSKALHKYLTGQNKLPEKPPKPERRKEKIEWKALFLSMLEKRHAKYYLFSGLSLGLMTFFTPYRIYYLVFCSVLLALSAVCLLKEHIKP